MKKILLLAVFAILFLAQANAQQRKFGTRKAQITFESEAKLENISAINNSANAVIDSETKKLMFAVLIKGFQFKKALMQEHFNENYLESSKFPKASFKGEILTDIDFFHAGSHDVQVKGILNIHGVSKEITIPAQITVSKKGLHTVATFDILLADFGIKIPSMVKEKIAKTITIKIDALLPMIRR